MSSSSESHSFAIINLNSKRSTGGGDQPGLALRKMKNTMTAPAKVPAVARAAVPPKLPRPRLDVFCGVAELGWGGRKFHKWKSLQGPREAPKRVRLCVEYKLIERHHFVGLENQK